MTPPTTKQASPELTAEQDRDATYEELAASVIALDYVLACRNTEIERLRVELVDAEMDLELLLELDTLPGELIGSTQAIAEKISARVSSIRCTLDGAALPIPLKKPCRAEDCTNVVEFESGEDVEFCSDECERDQRNRDGAGEDDWREDR
jgi:hypothetical protein